MDDLLDWRSCGVSTTMNCVVNIFVWTNFLDEKLVGYLYWLIWLPVCLVDFSVAFLLLAGSSLHVIRPSSSRKFKIHFESYVYCIICDIFLLYCDCKVDGIPCNGWESSVATCNSIGFPSSCCCWSTLRIHIMKFWVLAIYEWSHAFGRDFYL